MQKKYDAIVVGAGHAGCEAAFALARKGFNTLILSVSLNNVAYLACNPSIGGTSKGQLASEVDALGGEMGIVADICTIQSKLLNQSKGSAVQSLRVQVDKDKYHKVMRARLENEPNITLIEGEASEILYTTTNTHKIKTDKANVSCNTCNTENKKVCGIKLLTGEIFNCTTVVVATGVYLKSTIIMGEHIENVGPSGFPAANHLTESIINLGHKVRRFKTGTPPRLEKSTINFSVLEEQPGDDVTPNFSYLNTPEIIATRPIFKNKVSCHLTYTNPTTHKIIRNNFHLAPTLNGDIIGVGPRYCPSIESKVERFADRERHQLFLEPETELGSEVYIQGLSTSFGVDIQKQIVHSIVGLEKSQIVKNAYAIEYDAIDCLELNASLESKIVDNLFFAGQVNGTSGYEEAAAQGIVAGINAGLKMENKPPLILKRSDAYIGVLIDDLVTKGTNEPYRMMTSRAEYRLLLRQDNADIRLTRLAEKAGMPVKNRIELLDEKEREIKLLTEIFKTIKTKWNNKTYTLEKLCKTPEIDLTFFINLKNDEKLVELKNFNYNIIKHVWTELKYEGYVKLALEEIANSKKEEETMLPKTLNYLEIKGLKVEAAKKLFELKPLTLGEASRISGVSPADIMVLTIYLKLLEK